MYDDSIKHEKLIKKILDAKADVNLRYYSNSIDYIDFDDDEDYGDYTLLMSIINSMKYKYLPVNAIKLLIDAKADVNAKSNELSLSDSGNFILFNPLSLAIYHLENNQCMETVVKFLIEANADHNYLYINDDITNFNSSDNYKRSNRSILDLLQEKHPQSPLIEEFLIKDDIVYDPKNKELCQKHIPILQNKHENLMNELIECNKYLNLPLSGGHIILFELITSYASECSYRVLKSSKRLI